MFQNRCSSSTSLEKKLMHKKYFFSTMIVFFGLSISHVLMAEPLIVMDARGVKVKVGSSIDSDKPLKLEDGERITFIRADGVTTTLRGPFNDVPLQKKSTASDPKQALAALVSTRDAKTNSVGVIRAGTDAKPISKYWLIDVTRPGVRCLEKSRQPIFWRPDATKESSFRIVPADGSYQFDRLWPVNQNEFNTGKVTFTRTDNLITAIVDSQEFNISIIEIPEEISGGLLLAGYMLEKGCIQQADALLKQLQENPENK
jgi:hypothetical protein